MSNPCGLNITCEGETWRWQYKNEPVCMAACASPDTPIATPAGECPIAELQVGDLVYSIDRDAIRAVPIGQVRRVRVQSHSVLRIVLSGGAEIEISPRHPTADGRVLGELRSESGTYFAAGALIGSTLAR